ncbi:MAG TPA: hypothetical protein PKY20_04505 [Methanothrix sp.]|jgi:hypothetical protein|nr:hypothetical protein [Methanothrix sp.]HOU69767.1 hypothetical protein [Methanothrix sp.]HQE97442.1 hypothetical protein [Methanothrix sp.]HQJ78863.1 hypothetical protein [Methanothrix sp.]HUM80316.1 hypothetical protein [Methanothrix sp.]
MPESITTHAKDVERRICRLLDMDDQELAAEMERDFLLSDDRDRRICDTLDEMILEVDRLISCLDDMEGLQPEEEDMELIPR